MNLAFGWVDEVLVEPFRVAAGGITGMNVGAEGVIEGKEAAPVIHKGDRDDVILDAVSGDDRVIDDHA